MKKLYIFFKVLFTPWVVYLRTDMHCLYEVRKYIPGESTKNFNVSERDIKNKSPREGDYICRRLGTKESWLVPEEMFKRSFKKPQKEKEFVSKNKWKNNKSKECK